MKQTGELFTIRFNNKQVAVETYRAKGEEVYHIKFEDQEQIFITKTVNANTGEEFWTSVPEGNLKLAIAIGKLLDERREIPKQKTLF